MATKKQPPVPASSSAPKKRASTKKGVVTPVLLVDETPKTIKMDLTDLTSRGSSDPESVEKIAKEVISGQWNNSDGRDARLLAAGYDPNLINEKIKALRS